MNQTSTFYFALILAIILPSACWAQRPNYGKPKAPTIVGKITGVVIDTVSNAPAEFTSVALMDLKGEIVNGAITDDLGAFKLTEVKSGTYNLEISFLGYEKKIIRNVETTLKKPDLDLGKVYIRPDSKVLEEIVVVEEAAIIENKVDRIVYNADKDVSTNGDAADVLRKVPMLSVDLDGNVSMRGSSNIQILINGRPSGMFSSNVADALKMIPSDQIKSVEVITSPSAKYDGEGTAGIINIITQRKSAKGTSGSINLAVGNIHNRGSGSLSLSRGRFGFSFNGSAVYSIPQEGTSDFLRIDDLENNLERRFSRIGTNTSSRLGFRGNASAFYDLNAYNAINSSFQLRGFSFDRDGSLASNFNDPSNNLSQIYNRTNDGNTGRSGFEWTTDYTKKFVNEGQELSFAVQINGNNSDNDITYVQTSDSESLREEEITFNKGRNMETTLQGDYVHPFSKKVTLEVGAKSVLRQITSDYSFEQLDFGTGTFQLIPEQSDVFNYDQDVYAGYGSFRFNFGKSISMIAGARYEATDIEGDFRDFDRPFSNAYGNLLPSVIISKKIKGFNTLKLAYNKRIQRPSLRFVNPFVNNDDDRNLSFGNPELNPEISHQVELGYTAIIKGSVINTSVYYRHTDDVIENILDINSEGVSITTFSNLGTRQNFGLNIFGSYRHKKLFTLSGGIDLTSFNIEGTFNGERLSNTGVNYKARIIGSLNLPKDWKFETFSLLNGPRITVQGKLPSFSMINFGFKKEILNKRGSIGLTVTSPFSSTISFKTELNGDDFSQTSAFIRPFRSVGLSFGYRFGKLDFKAENRRSKIKNNDLKQGEDNEGGGGDRG